MDPTIPDSKLHQILSVAVVSGGVGPAEDVDREQTIHPGMVVAKKIERERR